MAVVCWDGGGLYLSELGMTEVWVKCICEVHFKVGWESGDEISRLFGFWKRWRGRVYKEVLCLIFIHMLTNCCSRIELMIP